MLIDYTIRVPESPLQHTGYDSIPEYEFVTLIGVSDLGETAYQRVKMGPRETFQERLRTARYAIGAMLRSYISPAKESREIQTHET